VGTHAVKSDQYDAYEQSTNRCGDTDGVGDRVGVCDGDDEGDGVAVGVRVRVGVVVEVLDTDDVVLRV
jgi:hypothetical protein